MEHEYSTLGKAGCVRKDGVRLCSLDHKCLAYGFGSKYDGPCDNLKRSLACRESACFFRLVEQSRETSGTILTPNFGAGIPENQPFIKVFFVVGFSETPIIWFRHVSAVRNILVTSKLVNGKKPPVN